MARQGFRLNSLSRKALCLFSVFTVFFWLGGIFSPAYAQCSGVTTGLIACYPFDGNVNDGSGNGNNGTAKGTIEYVQGVAGQACQIQRQ
ncbi:MAG: hypothetical protein BWK80_55175 [Desulfobacteraceae bacterium IS3]|nr:MAG: hypothetical protein BWK80_55175 [Desulfobacteraceae bacterium IS3]